MARSQPINFIYGANDNPPLTTNLMLGLQHCMGMASTLVLAIIIFSSAHAPASEIAHLIAACLFASGLGTVLMSLKMRYLGTGYLCPLLCEPAFLVVSLLAVKLGGLPLLFGMTLLAGLFQTVLAAAYPYIRKLFPIEVTGVVVLMVGLALIKPDIIYSTGSTSLNHINWLGPDLITSAATLFAMLILVVWGHGMMMRYCMLFGIIIGFIVAYWQGLLTINDFNQIANAPYFSWPLSFTVPHMQFSWQLLIPFLVATIAATLKGVGGITMSQQINDVTWQRPDQTNIRKGIFTNSISMIFGATTGCMGLGVANNNIGLAVATAISSRYIAITAGILFMCFAFLPKFAMIFVIMPKPVLGATLLFVTSYVLVGGLQLITSRMLDTRKIFIVGFSIVVGVTTQIAPKAIILLPNFLQTMADAPIVSTTIIATILSLIMRIGITRKVDLVLASPQQSAEKIKLFLEAQGRIWGADATAIERCIMGCIECMEALNALNIQDDVIINFSYDEYVLSVAVHYHGAALNLSQLMPSQTEIASNDKSTLAQLAANLLQQYSPNVQIQPEPGKDNAYVINMKFSQ